MLSIALGMVAGAGLVSWAGKDYTSVAMLQATSSQFMHITGPLGTLLQGNTQNVSSSSLGLSRAGGSSSRVIGQSCSVPQPIHTGLANATDPVLRKLSQYEAVCASAPVSRVSFFLSTPTTPAEATQAATSVAATLKTYALYNIAPLVIMEPVDASGNNLDFNTYNAGTYDSSLTTFFITLKADGISDRMMGMWTYFPEANMPTWGTVDPTLFAANVTRTVKIQKQTFPTSQATILLDSESYAPGAAWGDGSYVSLLPYVQHIPAGLIDSFGLQGFPWAAPSGGPDSLYDPKIYLQVSFAAEAAQALGIHNIWLNTGTFSRAYTNNARQAVILSPVQRQAMLSGVVAQARALQAQGFTVAVHLFAQDKSSDSEAIDWSYWHEHPGADSNTDVFKSFAHEITGNGLQLWLFDTD